MSDLFLSTYLTSTLSSLSFLLKYYRSTAMQILFEKKQNELVEMWILFIDTHVIFKIRFQNID